jgi:hypothetical protein
VDADSIVAFAVSMMGVAVVLTAGVTVHAWRLLRIWSRARNGGMCRREPGNRGSDPQRCRPGGVKWRS